MQATELTNKEFFTELEIALESQKFDEVEELRDYVSPRFAEHLTDIYFEIDDWWKKELIIHFVIRLCTFLLSIRLLKLKT